MRVRLLTLAAASAATTYLLLDAVIVGVLGRLGDSLVTLGNTIDNAIECPICSDLKDPQ